MAKVYTAREMRQAANAEELVGRPEVAAMLRQAADAMELIAKLKAEIESMEKAPLDGLPSHMNINAKVALAKMDFYKKVSALEGLPKREKKYEYKVLYNNDGKWRVYEEGLTLDEAQKLLNEEWVCPHRLVRREVGEWEEVRDGK